MGPADALWAELLAQGAVFRLEVLDHRLLVTIDPAGEHVDKKLKVEVHPRGDERYQGSGGKFHGLGTAACSAPMRPDLQSIELAPYGGAISATKSTGTGRTRRGRCSSSWETL